MNAMRLLLVAVVLAFMVVTVFHVQGYASSFETTERAWLATSYALAVDASIVACALLTRHAKTAGWAWAGYFVFTAASGLMNAAAIQPSSVYAWVYALFPTAAIGLLGFLARQADALAEAERRARADAAQLAREEAERRAEERRKQDEYNAERRAKRLAAKATPQPAQPALPRTATIGDWRAIRAGLNGDGANMDASRVADLVTGAGLALPSRRTVQEWAKETRER